MKKLLLIDGNSIMNRAFYGIMGNKMLSVDGKPTNALYGFLAILFKNLEEVNPDYMLIAFDSKTAADVRKKMYDGYKKNRHSMPEELREQMPEIKEILKAMNIKYLELSDFEGDDILGTAAKKFSNEELTSYILSGDRDLFQLVQDNIIVRIPRTKLGKTETEIYDEEKIKEENGLEPKDLIEVKALMGDSSDEIPGAPGIGPKTATELIQKYKTLENLYRALDKEDEASNFKPKVRESLSNNKDLVYLSRDLGRINLNATITDNVEDLKIEEWNKEEVYKLFKQYKFNRYIERFNLDGSGISNDNDENKVDYKSLFKIVDNKPIEEVAKVVYSLGKLIFDINYEDDNTDGNIINKRIASIAIYNDNENEVYYFKNISNENILNTLKELFESEEIKKIGYDLSTAYIVLKQNGININNISDDIMLSSYALDITLGKYLIDDIIEKYLRLSIEDYLKAFNIEDTKNKQIDLFSADDSNNEIDSEMYKKSFYAYAIGKIQVEHEKEMIENNVYDVYKTLDIPLIEVLSEMQFAGMMCDGKILEDFGISLKNRLEELTNEIHDLAGEDFNINSTKQLGVILFEKLKLPVMKKTKSGYSTDVDTLEALKNAHPIVEKILEYRTIGKLNSTYVEGLIPYINSKTGRIHSFFHQTITATGRISSTDPNLQNIPSHDELGKNIKKAFKAKDGYTFIDADYSQIELRVLADMSNDENMIKAFMNNEDIHREVASKVFNVPFDEVTKEQRSNAKAVNFGIVYGITGFGLSKQIGSTRKEADEYRKSYLEKFSGVKNFMDIQTEKAKEQGYTETKMHRRRYVPELKSSNFMVREFGKRVAMNTPIQGTAADIMKLAMIYVYKKLKESNLDAKLLLQVHDELLLEVRDDQKEEAKELLKNCMIDAAKLSIPVKVDVEEGKTWYDAK